MTDSLVASATYTLNLKNYYPVPGQIEAENYSAMFGIQTQATTDTGGGLNVGYFDANDWMDYDINVPTTGNYVLQLRLAGLTPAGTLQIKKGDTLLATVTPPNTGAYQTWQTVSVTVNLSAGKQTIRIFSTGSKFNLNWFKLN